MECKIPLGKFFQLLFCFVASRDQLIEQLFSDLVNLLETLPTHFESRKRLGNWTIKLSYINHNFRRNWLWIFLFFFPIAFFFVFFCWEDKLKQIFFQNYILWLLKYSEVSILIFDFASCLAFHSCFLECVVAPILRLWHILHNMKSMTKITSLKLEDCCNCILLGRNGKYLYSALRKGEVPLKESFIYFNSTYCK